MRRWLAITLLKILVLWQNFGSQGLAAEHQQFVRKGITLSYTVEGAGNETVVLLHGLHSSSEINWRLPGTISLLSEKYRVVALDLRGNGRSDKPTAAGSYGTEMVEDVIGLLDHLQIQQAHIVGYSLGGLVALKTAQLHPQRVVSVIMGGMGWLKEGSPLQKMWDRIPAREGAKTPAACLQETSQLAISEEHVKAITLPVSLIIGERDPVQRLYVPVTQMARPDWTVTTVEGAGHLNCLAKPKFRESLIQQLAQHRKLVAP